MDRIPLGIALAACLWPAVSARADGEAAATFGTGCAGASGVQPTLSGPPIALTGQPWTLEFSAGPNLSGLLFLSGQNLTWGGFTLPLDLGPLFGEDGCELLVAPDTTTPITTDALGNGSLELPPFAAGLTLYLQAYFVDLDPQVLDPLIALSNGVQIESVTFSGLQTGDLVITEFLKDPDFVTDASGEWIEVYNTTQLPIDLEQWTLEDDNGQAVVIDTGAPLIVEPYSYAVLARVADPAVNGGITPLYAWTDDGAFTLTDEADTIRLVTPDGVVIDEVRYRSDQGWLDATGASLALAEGIFEWDVNDDGSVWEVSTCFIGGTAGFNTDRGTPGLANNACPFPTIPNGSGELIFCEVIQNPAGVPDAFGEWFEVYNTTDAEIDMQGYSVTLFGGTFTVEGPLPVPAGGYQVFARNGDPALNGGLPGGVYDYPDQLALSNGSLTMVLSDPGGGTVCLLTYDNGLTFPDPTGASMALDPTRLTIADAIDGTAWCVSISPYGTAGDLGTPGAVNDDCP